MSTTFLLRIKKLSPTAITPSKGTSHSAGYDLYADNETTITISPHETQLIDTGIAVELPPFTFGGIFARSGIALKRGLAPANKVGVIDEDYRDSIKVALHNHTDEPQSIAPHERIAQLIVMPYEYTKDVIEIDDLSNTERGTGGFGSTGTN